MKKLLLLLLLPLASYCMDAPHPEQGYEASQLSYNHTDHYIYLQDNDAWVWGQISFRYIDDQTAKIVRLSVDKKIQHKGYGQILFQKCVTTLLAKNIQHLNWTVHALDGFDQELLCTTLYPKLVKKLENSFTYQLWIYEHVGKKNNKTKMVLDFNTN